MRPRTPASLSGVLALALVGALFACKSTASERARPPFTVPGADVVLVRPEARPPAANGPRILCVTAHPDDDIAFAGLVYKATQHLGATADVCVITDGQGGFKYATLAESEYGAKLTDEAVGRRRLPALRRAEMRRGCAHYGVRAIVHLDQPDHRYTQDVNEVLGPDAAVWNLDAVRRALLVLLARGDYDYVLVLTPLPDSHAHHQAASILACEAVAALPEEVRPAVLRVRTRQASDAPEPLFFALDGWPDTKPRLGVAPFVFDRTEKFGHQERLDYRIVVNWAIAEHRSQGTMQLLMNGADQELYELLDVSPRGVEPELQAFFERLREPQFEARTYGPSAGTNAGPR